MPGYKKITGIVAFSCVVFNATAYPANGDSKMPAISRRIAGPLKILSSNPRYFTDGSGRAIYVTGSHHWGNFQDYSRRPEFDYGAYLNLLRSHGHNLIRLWSTENAFASAGNGLWGDIHPLPYKRTGPGAAVGRQTQVRSSQVRSRIL